MTRAVVYGTLVIEHEKLVVESVTFDADSYDLIVVVLDESHELEPFLIFSVVLFKLQEFFDCYWHYHSPVVVVGAGVAPFPILLRGSSTR